LLDPLVDVFTMRQEDILSPKQAQDQSETDVEEDEDHRCDDDDDRDALDEQPDRESEHSRTDAVASCIAKERFGPTEVEREKTDSSAGQCQSKQRDIVLAHAGADEGEPSGSDDRPLGDIPVESIDKVHGVDGGHADDRESDDVSDSLS